MMRYKNIRKLLGCLGMKMKDIIHYRLSMPILVSMFEKCGEDVYIEPKGEFTYHNISIGNNVYIGAHASFMCANAKILIGSQVMFGPHVTIRTGDHRADVIGEYMINIKEKLPENNKNVIVEDDVWIGCNVTILKGVTIGKGSIIGAGSVVTKDVPSYTYHVGVPGIKEWPRFNIEQIKEHERVLNEKLRLIGENK